MVSSLVSAELIYTQCNHCGNSFKGTLENKPFEYHRDKTLFLPKNWIAEFSNRFGFLLTINDVKHSEFNTDGVYQIKIDDYRWPPFITKMEHNCPVTAFKIASTVENLLVPESKEIETPSMYKRLQSSFCCRRPSNPINKKRLKYS